jgi:hypothetical protein
MLIRPYVLWHPQGSEWESQAVGSGMNSESRTHARTRSLANFKRPYAVLPIIITTRMEI